MLDDASAAAGVTMTSSGIVTFTAAFAGKTTITATATGCANESLTKTIDIQTISSGPSSVDRDFVTGTISNSCSSCGDLKNAQNTCFTAGVIHQSGFIGKKVTAKVRFEGGVRNFEIAGSPTTGAADTPGFDLYFRQSDFDNYHGTLALPTGPSDTQGKENLRLMIQAANPVNGYPVQKIKPTVTWNATGQWWVVSYQFSNQGLAIPWPASTFKVFLSDAQVPLVKLESFSGNHTAQGDVLTWKTIEQTSFDHFEIENSEDPLQGFNKIATVSSNNNPSGGEYNYTHVPSAALKQYYRLKMVYSDNTFAYSKIITVRSDIIYQHNFTNLDNPPSEAQLITPDIIAPGFTSSWTGNSGSLASFNRVGRGTVLVLNSTNTAPVLILKLKVPNCKKLEITDFSLVLFTGSSSDARIRITGKGDVTFQPGVAWTPVNVVKTTSNITGEITIEISQPTNISGRAIYVDDFTVFGTVTDNLVDLRTLNLSSVTQRCQKAEVLDYSPSNKGEYKSIQYSLDDASIAAGNQINTTTGLVTFVPTFSGQSTVSASAVSCVNIPLSASKNVITNPGGLTTSSMDFKTTFPDQDGSPYDFDYGNLKNGCYTAGFISSGDLSGVTVTGSVRFSNNIRTFEIHANPYQDEYTNVILKLYFSQSDFDNYPGTLQLPKNPSDEEGKANLRLRLFEGPFSQSQSANQYNVKPYLAWDDVQLRWIATLNFAGGQESNPGNAPWAFPTFRVSLSDAGGGLPVKLESITAKTTPEGNRISWKTTEEINFSYFEIEKSEDPRQGFQYLATVLSAKSPSGSNYHYTDVPSSALQQYYRLKMVDFDGSFEYSKIVTAGGQLNEEPLLVYPNPAQNNIFLQSPDAVKSVKLVDQKGNEVFSRFFLGEGNSLSIPLPKLSSGAYYLKVNAGAENQQVRKVLIR